MTNTDTKKPEPKYLQIYTQIQQQILSGELKPGERLPSFSELRAQHGAMPATSERVYARLEREHLVIRKPRSGTYVAPRELARTGNIGLILHSAYQTPNYNSPYTQILLEGMRASSQEQGMKIVLVDGGEESDLQQVDGILFCCDKLEAYAMGIPPQVPQVIALQHAHELTAVTVDDFSGSRAATNYLIERGHRRIACLMEEWTDIPIQRRGGYQAALQEAGIAIDPAWLRLPPKMCPKQMFNYLEWGRLNMRVWLDENWCDLNCTAIVAQNDHVAIGVMQTLQEAGFNVPGDVSVIGFDGTDICDLARPRLTSMVAPLHDIGYEAIKVLCEQIRSGVQTPREISLQAKIREGESVLRIGSEL